MDTHLLFKPGDSHTIGGAVFEMARNHDQRESISGSSRFIEAFVVSLGEHRCGVIKTTVYVFCLAIETSERDRLGF